MQVTTTMPISLCASPSPMSRSAWSWNYMERGARTHENVSRTGSRGWKGGPFREERPHTGQASSCGYLQVYQKKQQVETCGGFVSELAAGGWKAQLPWA